MQNPNIKFARKICSPSSFLKDPLGVQGSLKRIICESISLAAYSENTKASQMENEYGQTVERFPFIRRASVRRNISR